jgi:hypothetical protein
LAVQYTFLGRFHMPAAKTARKKPPLKKKPAANRSSTKKPPGMSEAAIERGTGKPWDHWLKVLDAFDVRKHGHTAAAAYVHEEHGAPEWWCQMVVVNYEQARALRKKHQVADGYSVSGSRVMNVPLATLFKAWQGKARAKWLADPAFNVRTATENKSMRITWTDGKTHVEVMFYAKGEAKSLVTVQHRKLASSAAAKKMKAYWGAALDGLKEYLKG